MLSLSVGCRNNIIELDGVFPLLGGLTSLNALDNKLTSLPIRIGGLTSLRELVLDQIVWDNAAKVCTSMN